MSCITSELKTTIEADLVIVLAGITALSEALTSNATSGTKSYSFDSGTGRAAEVFSSPQEIIAALKDLMSLRDLYKRQLNGTAVVRQAVRT